MVNAQLNTLTPTALLPRLMPLVFLAIAFALSVPPLTWHLLTHPRTYILTTQPLSTRAKQVQQKFFYYSWRIFSPLLDPGDRPYKQPLLHAHASGVVLEVGAGIGDNIKYYDRSRVTRLVLVEPNADMHPRLRANALAAGFSEAAHSPSSLLILGCGAAEEDYDTLAAAGVSEGTVDTIALVHVMCGIPGPARAIEMYRRLLRPGTGKILWFEHVRSTNAETARWQDWYTDTVWDRVLGCHLNRPTGDWILRGPDAGELRPEEQENADFVKARMQGTGFEPGHAEFVRARMQGGGVNGALPDGEEVVRRRWSEWRDLTTKELAGEYACTPHVMGWAVKA